MKVVAITAPNPGAYTLQGTQSYVINQRVVIDPGPEISSHIDALAQAAPHLGAILVTHRHADHAPATRRLKELSGARVYAARGAVDAELVDVELRDDLEISYDGVHIRAIATPGHTAEHFCFLTPDRGLFTGDTVLGTGTTVIFPPDGDMAAYMATLEKLIDLDPLVIYPGHGPVRHDAVPLLREYIDHRRMRERQIIDGLRQGESRIDGLRARIYPGLDPRLIGAAELQIEAHLVDLEGRGVVRGEGGSYWVVAL